MARVIAQRVAESLGQTVVVDNRSGGGGTIGVETVVRAEPDGYTLIMVSGSYATNAAVFKLAYDPLHDIQPIIMTGETGFALAAHPSVPTKTVSELVAYARANPGKLNYGSAGTGSISHLAGELLKAEAKVGLVHVPYKGSGPVLTDLIGGQIQLLISSIPAALPQAKAGRLRVLGITSARRASTLPEVPTVGETIPGYEVVMWYGVWGPKGLPRSIVMRWNIEVGKVLQTDEMKTRMAADGLDPAGGPPEQFLKSILRDIGKWKRVVKQAKITVEG